MRGCQCCISCKIGKLGLIREKFGQNGIDQKSVKQISVLILMCLVTSRHVQK